MNSVGSWCNHDNSLKWETWYFFSPWSYFTHVFGILEVFCWSVKVLCQVTMRCHHPGDVFLPVFWIDWFCPHHFKKNTLVECYWVTPVDSSRRFPDLQPDSTENKWLETWWLEWLVLCSFHVFSLVFCCTAVHIFYSLKILICSHHFSTQSDAQSKAGLCIWHHSDTQGNSKCFTGT